MLEKKYGMNNLYKELSIEEQEEYFSFNQKSFLNNVDTFYYSVKFKNDFRADSKDKKVFIFRKYFENELKACQKSDVDGQVSFDGMSQPLVLKSIVFSRFYNITLTYPEYFDIFFAPVVPKSSDGGESLTAECIVQIRSYMLWQMGVRDAFENSYAYVKAIAAKFGLEIDHVQENRCDYCWHTNYLDNPEKFFAPENLYKMRVDRFKNATYVTNKVGDEDYEIDYVAMGKRSSKVFLRIYLKTREVVEQGYKPWFFQIWYQNGMISKYDKYVYERAYEKRSWFYRFYARLEFYRDHGCDPLEVDNVDKILKGEKTIEENDLIKLCDRLTPRLHNVVNVEYQTMRRHSKSYELLPIHDNTDKAECKRVYDYIDNRKLIQDYLTFHVFRLVQKDDEEVKKSKRDLCAFWKELRRTRCLDMKMTKDEVKLLRNYNRKLNIEAMKKRVINGAVTLGFYSRGINYDSPLQDAMEALCKFNDNDIKHALSYKQKKRLQLNRKELADVYESNEVHRFELLDTQTGVLYDNITLNKTKMQDDFEWGDYYDYS